MYFQEVNRKTDVQIGSEMLSELNSADYSRGVNVTEFVGSCFGGKV